MTTPGPFARPADPAARLAKALIGAVEGDITSEVQHVLTQLKRTVDSLGLENIELRGPYRDGLRLYKKLTGKDYV